MTFIGVVAEKKDIYDIEKNLKNYFENQKQTHNVFLIQNSNIENMKNIKFETILMCGNGLNEKNQNLLKQVIKSANYIIVNCDTVKMEFLGEARAKLITYGFQAKATITMSSVDDENMIVCVQREFQNVHHINIEAQEINLPQSYLLGNKYSKLGSFIVELLYQSQKNKKS